MRWGASREEFVRPVHWVVVMLGQHQDFGTVMGLETGNTTRGHRFHCDRALALEKPEDYASVLENAHVIASFDERKARIEELINDNKWVHAATPKLCTARPPCRVHSAWLTHSRRAPARTAPPFLAGSCCS